MTVKLYDADSFLKEFTATVTDCKESENGYAVTLDRTAFFPEGGGQASDRGWLDEATVSDVQIENNVIYHTVARPFSVGETVTGKLDFDRRFDFMQNHSGEHIVSGVVHRLYGLENVGFHLGEEFTTLDFNGMLSREQIDKAEEIANRAVAEDVAFTAWYPENAERKQLDYRSKKELTGAVRLVKIDGYDLCACCAPHVKTAGQIGLIKLLDAEKLRGGVRLVLKCGKRALYDYRNKYENVREIGNLLSAKQEETAVAVTRLSEQLNAEKQKNAVLKRRLIETLIENSNAAQHLFFADGLDGKELQLLADGLFRKKGGVCAVFTPIENGFSFAICGGEPRVRECFDGFRQHFAVRGGGRNGLFQGTVLTDEKSLKSYFHFL